MGIKLKPIEEQVIVITGASSGIGLATAKLAASRGAKVVLAARSANTLGKIAQSIIADGGQAYAVTTDVQKREDLEALAAEAVQRFGRIDSWVNDAGVAIYGRLDEVSETDSRALFDTNFWGVVNGSLVALPHLKQSNGALINVGSEVSDAVVPLQGMYSASKHAVKGFTDALRIELEEVDKASIAITLIQPTAVDTPYPQHARNYMDKESKLPTPQIDPYEVAEAILSAACKHQRDIKVGMGSKINTLVSKLMPGMADKMSAKQADRQHYEEPPRHPEGTLTQPGESGPDSGNVHGSGGVEKPEPEHRS